MTDKLFEGHTPGPLRVAAYLDRGNGRVVLDAEEVKP